MNQTVIEAQAHYLIQDRIHLMQRTQLVRYRRRRLRTLSWV